MVSINRQHCYSSLLLLVSLITLTGCPGDRWRPNEETTVSVTGDNICFFVPDAEDYQPVDIAIYPRGTPSRQQKIIFNPALHVVNGQLCVPPSFYAFPEEGQFIISYVLQTENNKKHPRRMVSGVEISNGCVFNIPLTDMEIARPDGAKRDLPEYRKVYCK